MRRPDVVEAARLVRLRLPPWLRYFAARGAYRLVDPGALRERRRSDTVFVFGSGASLNDIPGDEWDAIAAHDTFGFNWFVHERFVRCDFHLIRGIPDTDLDPAVWKPQLAEYFRLIATNPCFAETAFLVHGGFRAINGNRALGHRLLPADRPVLRWRTQRAPVDAPPSRSFAAGLVHGHSTIQEAINAAYLLGWRRIVLAGVDLYDRRYFWLPPEETRSVDVRRGADAATPHNRAASGMVATLGRWREWLLAEGVELEVYNPRSLLAEVLPVAASHSS
jgi:hypothetical protein